MEKKATFFDGAFGTYYFDITKDFKPCELANIHSPQLVVDIHKKYIESGVDNIKTNTYSVNSNTFSDTSQQKLLIKTAMHNAKKAVENTNVKIFCDIGYINLDEEKAKDEYIALAEYFITQGGENFLFETMAEYNVLIPAINYIKSKVSNSVIIVSFAVSQDGYSKKGIYYKTLLEQAANNTNVDILGLNCQCSPTHMRNLVQNLNKQEKPLLIMPNSSYPSSVDGRMTFVDNAEYFAQKMQEIYQNGADIIGGCCGTTPSHIKLAIDYINNEDIVKKVKDTNNVPLQIKNEKESLPYLCKTKKVFAVELDPPMNADMAFSISAAYKLKEAEVDIITVADSPLARARADSIMSAAKIKREVGINVMPHISCRDKNQIALKGSFIGANFENITNILAVTGDAIMQDIYSNSAGVFTFNSYTLISFMAQLNKDVLADSPISIGGALNTSATNFDKELLRAKKKIENGAEYFLSQPLFSQKSINNFILASKTLNVPILAGIMPLASYKNAVFLNNEVSGITIEDEIIDSLKDKTKEEILDISSNFCLEIAKQINDYCNGYYIMTPLKRVDLVIKVIEKIKSI